MAKQITGLPVASAASATDSDLLLVRDVETGTDKQVTRSNLLNNAVSTTAIANKAVTPAKTSIFNYQTDNSNSVSNVIDGAISMQVGWSQATGNNTQNMTADVTFSETFTTVLGVVVTLNAVRSGAAAANITALNSPYNTATTTFAVSAGDVTTSGFTAYLGRNASTFSTTTYYGFSWIAWGIM